MTAGKCKCGYLPSGGMEWNEDCPKHGRARQSLAPALGSAPVGGLLVCLAEECAEIAQSACKALRFGLRDEFRGEGLWPERDIAAELDDLRAVVDLLEAEGLVLASDPARIAAKKAKLAKMNAYADSNRQEAQNGEIRDSRRARP